MPPRFSLNTKLTLGVNAAPLRKIDRVRVYDSAPTVGEACTVYLCQIQSFKYVV
jgi:hypothetical protein